MLAQGPTDLEDDDPKRTKKGSLRVFIHKLYRMLEDPLIQHLIWWSPNNELFFLTPSEEFCQVLLTYFKHLNVASFVRQLNMYGFHKQNDEKAPNKPVRWEFAHSLRTFRKGDLAGLRNIRRRSLRTPNERRTSGSLDPEPPDAAELARALTALRHEHAQVVEELRRTNADLARLADAVAQGSKPDDALRAAAHVRAGRRYGPPLLHDNIFALSSKARTMSILCDPLAPEPRNSALSAPLPDLRMFSPEAGRAGYYLSISSARSLDGAIAFPYHGAYFNYPENSLKRHSLNDVLFEQSRMSGDLLLTVTGAPRLVPDIYAVRLVPGSFSGPPKGPSTALNPQSYQTSPSSQPIQIGEPKPAAQPRSQDSRSSQDSPQSGARPVVESPQKGKGSGSDVYLLLNYEAKEQRQNKRVKYE